MGDAGTERLHLDRIADNSHVLTSLRKIARTFAIVTQWLAEVTRHAFLYRWLTKEPDPYVIVIDLRETYTIGPVVTVLDSLFDVFAPIWNASRTKRATDGLATVLDATAETRTGRAIVRLLYPPEPPERRDD